MVVAAHHITYPWLHSLPFLPVPAGRAQCANFELVSALVVAIVDHGDPDGMVWYVMCLCNVM